MQLCITMTLIPEDCYLRKYID